MKCAWDAYVSLLPHWLREILTQSEAEKLLELRLRAGQQGELVLLGETRWTNRHVSLEDLRFCINAASRYSPWAAETIAQGYITAAGGHRIGICGEATVSGDTMKGIRIPRSLCLRVARDFPGIASKLSGLDGSTLIVGPPGSGKTTLLRDLIRGKSDLGQGSIAVIDERGELFPYANGTACFYAGRSTDILSGCPKLQGVEAVLRTMGPKIIAVDEITAEADCHALIHAGWCGVKLLATAHAHSGADLEKRPVYKPLVRTGLFENLVVLREDKSWTVERLKSCT